MNADLLAVKYLLKNSSFSGYYTSASSISKLIYWFLFAFASALLPYVSKSFHSQNYDDTRKYVVGILRYSMLLTSPAVVLISVYSEDIITLVYGTDYSNAGNILSVLIFGLFGLSMMAILGNALIGIEKVGIMAKYAITGAISSILLNMLLVPHMGCLGGSVSTTVSSVVVAILSYATLARDLKINININSVMRVVFSLTAILMISINVKGKCYPFMISFTLLYLTFFIVLYALKEITKKDIVIITDSFNSLVNKKRSKKLNSPKTQEPI